MTKSKKVLVSICVCLFSLSFYAQQVSYHFRVHTKDVTNAGTDNHIYFQLKGDKGKTPWIQVKGNSERDDIDEFTYEGKNIGNIKKLVVDVDGVLADKWDLDYVYVTKGSKMYKRNHENGYYEFTPNKEMSYDKETFKPSYFKLPRLNLKPNGRPQQKSKHTTIVNFGSNSNSSVPQDVMRYKESWSTIESVSVSKATASTIGAAATLSYTSPETVAGTFGAEFSASYEETISNEKTQANEKQKSSEFEWTYTAPAGKDILRKITFEIPYEYQEYKVGEKKFYLRKLHAEIIPITFDFIEIPKTIDEKIIPINWYDIENHWLPYANKITKKAILNKKNGWLKKRYVFLGKNNVKPNPDNTVPNNTKYVRILNRWKKDGKTTYGINIEGKTINATGIQPNWWSAQWELEPVEGNQDFYRIKNRWKKDGKTSYYIHNEKGKVEAGAIKKGWWSAQWKLIKVGNSKFYRIQNRWKTNEYLHIEKPNLESGPIKLNWWSAQWLIE